MGLLAALLPVIDINVSIAPLDERDDTVGVGTNFICFTATLAMRACHCELQDWGLAERARRCVGGASCDREMRASAASA